MVHSYRKFDQFQELPSTGQRSFFLWKNAGASANLPVASSNFFENAQYEKVANPASGWYQRQYSQCAPQQGMPQYNPWQAKPLASASFAPYSRVFKQKETLWEEFKRIYINEVIAFTMSKSTLFTLIFSFMFLLENGDKKNVCCIS